MGVQFIEEDGIRVIGPDEVETTDVKTFTSFPTDMQAQMTAQL